MYDFYGWAKQVSVGLIIGKSLKVLMDSFGKQTFWSGSANFEVIIDDSIPLVHTDAHNDCHLQKHYIFFYKF